MTDAIARRYHRFAEAEAKGHSALYEACAHGVEQRGYPVRSRTKRLEQFAP